MHAGDVIAGQKFGRAAGVLVALGVAPAFFFGVGGLIYVGRRNVFEHEALAVFVAQHAAFAANAFGDQNAANAGRPDHSGGMELHEFHIHQRRAGVIGERVAVAGIFPAVAGDGVGAADAAGGEHHGFGAEKMEAAALAVVAERAGDAVAIFQQGDDGVFHENVEAEMNAVVLQGADHFEAGAIADVGEPGIAMAAEIALEDAPVFGAVENRAPGFEFVDAVGRFFGVQFGHAPVVQILAAAHGVGEVHAPTVAVVDIAHGGGDAAFGHDGVGFAQQRFRDDGDFYSGGRSGDCGTQSGAARTDDEYVVIVGDVIRHH